MLVDNTLTLTNTLTTVNPLTSKSDQHLISPYNITAESNMEVTRKKGNDH